MIVFNFDFIIIGYSLDIGKVFGFFGCVEWCGVDWWMVFIIMLEQDLISEIVVFVNNVGVFIVNDGVNEWICVVIIGVCDQQGFSVRVFKGGVGVEKGCMGMLVWIDFFGVWFIWMWWVQIIFWWYGQWGDCNGMEFIWC